MKQNITEVWTAGHYINAYWQWSRSRWGLKGQGCYDDECGSIFSCNHDLEFKTSSETTMSVDFCIASCRDRYKYCGLQNGYECYCGGSGDKFGKKGPASGCNTPCQHNPHFMCGGKKKNSIYSTRAGAYSEWWNYHPESTSKQCAAMAHKHAYQWLEDSCFMEKAYICQQNNMLNGSDVCRFQTLSYKFCVSISKPGETANWFQAREKCQTMGPDVDLVTLDEAHKQQAMKDYLAKTPEMVNDFWIGVTRNQILWNLDGKMNKYTKVYVSRFDNSSTFDKLGHLLFHATKDGYRLKDIPDHGKTTAGFICQNDLPTTTGSPTTSSMISPSAKVTSDEPFIPIPIETTPTTTTTTTDATEASTTTQESDPGNSMGQGGGTALDDNKMLAIYVACGGGALLIILVIVAIVIAKRKKPAKKREKTFKINYAPSIQDLNRRSTNIIDGNVTIQAAEDNIYTDPATAMQGGAKGVLYDNADDHKRQQTTNKARMRAIKEGMYDVPKPRLSEIPPAPGPVGIDDRKPAPLPAGEAIKADELNKGHDSTNDTQPIYDMDENPTEYSYAYGGFMEPPQPEAGKASGGKSTYERLVN